MLPWTALFCLVSANLVASQLFLPEIFGSYDPRTILKPYKNELKSGGPSDDLRVIRALLTVRQTECPVGTAECTNVPGRLALQFAFLSLLHRVPHAFCSWSPVCCFTMSAFDWVCLILGLFYTAAVQPAIAAAIHKVSLPAIYSAPLIPDLDTHRIDCCAEGSFCYGTGCCQTGYTGCGGIACCAPTDSCCSGGGCCDAEYVGNLSHPWVVF